MTARRWRYLQAGTISVILLALVLWISGIQSIDLSVVRPILLVPTVTAYVVLLLLRGASFRVLVPAGGAASPARWIALAARHQLAFVLAPSGTGDMAFPVLARQLVWLELGDGARLIAEARLRDLCVLGGLGCAGLVGAGIAPTPVLIGSALAAVGLYRVDLAIAALSAVLCLLRRKPAPAPLPSTGGAGRFRAAILPILLWIAASAGVSMGFRAVGHPLGLYESWVMLAGLNFAGALAFSVAGFGVAEAGATGVLVLLGQPLPQAATIAIVARPLLLLSNATACALIELATRGRRTNRR